MTNAALIRGVLFEIYYSISVGVDAMQDMSKNGRRSCLSRR